MNILTCEPTVTQSEHAIGPNALGGLCPSNVLDAKIVVVDDEPVNIKVVTRLLRIEGYTHFESTSDARKALNLIRYESPDLVLLDLMMPHVSGQEILTEMRQDPRMVHTPVVILTASTDRPTRIAALKGGANDFLNKPIDPSELAPRVGNLLTLKHHQNQLSDYSKQLETEVYERTAQLEASRRDILHCLAKAAEFRDDDTGYHILRVGRYARITAEALGFDSVYVDCIEQAAQLHDVGKIGISDDILKKPGRLTEDEFDLMQKHASIGKRILQRFSPRDELALRLHADIGAKVLGAAKSPVLEMATSIALTHHEWWDGTGYPLGLQGLDIPIEGRITAVADVFDALSTKRCYKDAVPVDACFSIMKDEVGTHFDPQVFEAFVSKRDEVVAIQKRLADEA